MLENEPACSISHLKAYPNFIFFMHPYPYAIINTRLFNLYGSLSKMK